MKKWKKNLAIAAMSFSMAAVGVVPAFAEETTEAVTETAVFEEETEDAPVMIGSLGGWKAAESFEVTDDLKAVFEKAVEKLIGVNYEPVAFLGSQLVSGTNYCFLAKSQVVYLGAKPSYAIVYVYENLEGQAAVLDITNIRLNMSDELELDDEKIEEAVTEVLEEPENIFGVLGGVLLGGWETSEDPAVDEELSGYFTEATSKLLGVDYEPIAFLGSQVVSGKNYCFLARTKVVYPGAQPELAKVYVYVNTDGEASVLEVEHMEFGLTMDETEEEAVQVLSTILGGWKAMEDNEITEEQQAIFDEATGKLLGVNYKAMSILSSQAVAGTNYCFLAKTQVVAPDTEPEFALVYVNVNLDGEASVIDVDNLAIGVLGF